MAGFDCQAESTEHGESDPPLRIRVGVVVGVGVPVRVGVGEVAY